jgi:TolA-binding protein
MLTRSEFEVAKIAYGLTTTGVIEIRKRGRLSAPAPATQPAVAAYLDRAFAAITSGDLRSARASLEVFLELAPDDPDAERARTALHAVEQLLNLIDASPAPASRLQPPA